MSRRVLRFLLPLLLLIVWIGAPVEARAAPNDEDVELLVITLLETDYAGKSYGDALEKLELAQEACQGKACSPKIRAKVYIALGTVLSGGLNKPAEAKAAFQKALKADPKAQLFTEHTSAAVQAAFDEARGVTKEEPPAAAQPKRVFPGGGKPPKGWRSAEAYFYFREAVGSEKGREWVDCAEYAAASLAAENRASTRYLGATCLERAGRWVEAQSDYEVVADTARSTGLHDLAAQAKQRSEALVEKIPKLVLRAPARATDVVVTLDDKEIPASKLGGEMWVDPGARVVHATGKVDGVVLVFDQTVEVSEFETATVDVKLTPKQQKAEERAVVRCMLEAKTRDDFAKCLDAGKPAHGFTVRGGLEVSAYSDSNNVDVVTPALFASVENAPGGWGVSGSFLVDVVTAASPDIIATASPRWTEVRYVPALGGHKKFGEADVSLRGSMSVEPDYQAVGIGGGVSADILDKMVTPSIGYDFGSDISGRTGTSFDVFSRHITRHGFDLGATFVVDKATFVGVAFTAVIEDGDTSKPYRYIPMFAADVASRVPVGLTIDSVNQFRLPERVLEQLPTDRQRWAIAGRVGRRFASSTIRLEQRLYTDSWGVIASSTDARYLMDLTSQLRVWPHLRFHAQGGADFWNLAYVGERTPTGLKVPALRSGDAELGPLVSATLGGGVRYAFGPDDHWSVSLQGDIFYTRFLEHLFQLQRIGVFGATTLEMEFN